MIIVLVISYLGFWCLLGLDVIGKEVLGCFGDKVVVLLVFFVLGGYVVFEECVGSFFFGVILCEMEGFRGI